MNKLRFALLLSVAISLRSLAAATVTAELSADETSVGTPVQMQVSVEGTTNVVMPDSLGVDGLDSRLTGRQTLVQITNGRMSTSGVYFYTIIPQHEGTFEIPPIEINADGHKERTSPQKLLVQPGTAPNRPAPAMPMAPGTSSSRKHRKPASQSSDAIADAELIVPKTTIYAGEVVPVEIRVRFRGDAEVKRIQQEPDVSGEGFTVQKLSPAVQTQEDDGDASYAVLSFKTSITAVKSGDMQLPAVSMQAILGVPTDAPAGMPGIFGQLMNMTEDREVDIKSDPKSIHVKALPIEGRPANFSGAVGDFTIAASADPTKVPAGDPVTLKVEVSGRGNFDAMGEPTLLDADGWKVYPPTRHFDKADAVGYGGTNTFETPMVALQPQTRTPGAEFSFFDPEKEKYFTIKTQPIAVEAAADQATQATAASTTPNAKPSATPAQNQDGAWLVNATPRSWQPLAKRPEFWFLNGAAAVVLIGAAAGLAVRRSRQGAAGHRAAQVRLRSRLVGELGRADLPDDAFYAKALEVLVLQAGLAGESGPFELARSLEKRGRNVGDLHTVLARADELKFSGGAKASTHLDEEQRRKVVRAILEVCR